MTMFRRGDLVVVRHVMGLLSDSIVVTDNLATVLHREIDKVIGTCPRMADVDIALRRTLSL